MALAVGCALACGGIVKLYLWKGVWGGRFVLLPRCVVSLIYRGPVCLWSRNRWRLFMFPSGFRSERRSVIYREPDKSGLGFVLLVFY